MADRPEWIDNLPSEDLAFMRSFVLSSGSLKAVAADYGVSYPTIRLRLDNLIERLKQAESAPVDPFRMRLKTLVADGDLDHRLAKELLELHRTQLKEGTK